MKQVLGPFLAGLPRWRSRPWLLALFLLVAPVVFLLGRYFQAQSGRASVHTFEGYDEIVARARATAKALRIPAGDWKPTLRVTPGADFNLFAQQERDRLPASVRRVLPAPLVNVLLIGGDRSKWVEFRYSGEGQLLGYHASPGMFTSDAMLAQSGTREVAQSALEAVLDPAAFEFGEPSARSSDGGMGQHFEWSVRAKCCPELIVTAAVEVVGSRPADLAIETAFTPEYQRQHLQPLNLLANVLLWAFLVSAIIFAGYRFAKRAMEREVPYARAAVIWGAVATVGVISAVLQPFALVGLETAALVGPFWYAGIVIGLLVYLVAGILLALAYGATEGDLRELMPGSLTSLDALLSGRVLSQNVGVSILVGSAWGSWMYGLTQMARVWLAPGYVPLHASELRYSYSQAPWLGLLSVNVLSALAMAITMVLVARSMGARLGGRRAGWRRVVTSLCACGAVTLWGPPFTDTYSMLFALSVLTTLWVGIAQFDFLATLAALVASAAGSGLVDLQAMMPAWEQPGGAIFWVRAALLLLAVQCAYRGRRYADAEVKPSYARNIEDRRARREEVSAAREAQLRLLPDKPPPIPGLGLAAFCAPATEGVSGDFFDFYPMSRGRLGLLVADGRAGGLGAALTIALAKGFVQYAAHRDWPAGETLRRLRDVWQRDGHTEDELNLAYAVLDPAQRQIRFARLGPTPVILAGLDAQDTAEPLTGPVSDGLTEGSAAFAHGDVLLFYTDGVPQRLAASHRDGLPAWLRNKLRLSTGVTAYRIGEALQEALRAQEGNAPHDLTAVVIRFEPVESASLEVSA